MKELTEMNYQNINRRLGKIENNLGKVLDLEKRVAFLEANVAVQMCQPKECDHINCRNCVQAESNDSMCENCANYSNFRLAPCVKFCFNCGKGLK